MIVLNAHLPNGGPIAMTVVCTIMLSILTHGVTADPWAKAYGARRRPAEGSAGKRSGKGREFSHEV